MSIPDPILKLMLIRFKAARVFLPSGCINLNDRLPCIDYDKQRNQIRVEIEKQNRKYKISARRLAIYLSTGKLPDQPIFVTCSNFHCINPEHLRLGSYGDRSAVKNHKRDCREENLNRKLNRTVRNGRKTGYYSYTYSESHVITDPEKMPEWAKYPEAIDVRARTIENDTRVN